MNPFEGPGMSPLPMTRKEARAAGLKSFTALLACHRCGSRQRTVHAGVCCGCQEVEQRKRKALAEKVRERVLVYARAQVIRQLEREAREATKAAEKEAKAKQRTAAKEDAARQRRAEARAAARAARKAATAEERRPVDAPDSPPWEDLPIETNCAAPWD